MSKHKTVGTRHRHAAPSGPVGLRPGSVPPPITPGHSQAHKGGHPLRVHAHRNTGYQPLPVPLGLPPYHYDLADQMPDLNAQILAANKVVIHLIADTGGVKDAQFQHMVADEMIRQASGVGGAVPNFCYHVGDVVYFTGLRADYYSQFYEPYAQYTPPIFSVPGNHDGEVDDPSVQTSLDGWADYFMQAQPDVDPIAKDSPRVGLNLPNPYWTLVTPFATIVGMYTNVPEGGSIDSVQQQWLTNEFASAPTDRALILALHHPIYSFDNFHSGSSKMADALENAVRDSGRVPNLVVSGHVHDYQRIEQSIHSDSPTPFLVTGNGGYHNLHSIHSAAGSVAPDTGATLMYGADRVWGFVTLTIDVAGISGIGTEIDRNGNVAQGDSFSYPSKAMVLQNMKRVPTL